MGCAFSSIFENIEASERAKDDDKLIIPGRRDLRISLTASCNLACNHCHNEGQTAPWLNRNDSRVTLEGIRELIEMGARYGARSVKFTGGDPGVFHDLYGLLQALSEWQIEFPTISKWSMSTNGTPFLNAKKFAALVQSRLTNISIGIDSVEPGEFSKPSSSYGVDGHILFDRFVRPLAQAWQDRGIKIDAVFTGNEKRILNVVKAARDLDINASVLEINDVMKSAIDVRDEYLNLISNIARDQDLEARLYKPLNEVYLFDQNGRAPIRFYQDHCQDRDCGNCRKVHMRVSPLVDGWGAVPCFLQAQAKTIPLTVNAGLSAARFEDAILYNGRGPWWFKNTPYDDQADQTLKLRIQNLTAAQAAPLLRDIEEKWLKASDRQRALQEATNILKALPDHKMCLVEYPRGFRFVQDGKLVDHGENAEHSLQYSHFALAMILSGQVIVEDENKVVKRLLPGDFMGVFETADYLNSGLDRKIGDWALYADYETRALYFANLVPVDASAQGPMNDFVNYIIDFARQNVVPKPISDQPLLDWLSIKLNSARLSDTLIVAHMHMLPSSVALARHLAFLVDPESLLILEKPYSRIGSVRQQILGMGCNLVPGVVMEDTPYEFTIRVSLDVLWTRILNICKKREIKRIVILDSGADILLSVPWEQLCVQNVLGVEQTEHGIERLASSGKKIPPVINVAASPAKKNIEAAVLARSCVDKIRSLGLIDNNVNIGIVGRGNMLGALGRELKSSGCAIAKYDCTHRLAQSEFDCDLPTVSSIDALICQSDIVIGCSGEDFLRGVDLQLISGKKIFISASSADVEFLSLLSMSSYGNDFDSIVIDVHPDLRVQVLNAGYPINFDRTKEWETVEDMQITRSLAYAGLMQALLLDDSALGIEELKRDFQEDLLAQWWNLKRMRYGINHTQCGTGADQ